MREVSIPVILNTSLVALCLMVSLDESRNMYRLSTALGTRDMICLCPVLSTSLHSSLFSTLQTVAFDTPVSFAICR